MALLPSRFVCVNTLCKGNDEGLRLGLVIL
jgi:hypothetical protein